MAQRPTRRMMSGVELRFVPPSLSELDALESEVLACTVWKDVRPCDGVAGLCDWRFAGRVSKLQKSGYLRGQIGEVLLVPGRPRLGFEKLLFFGAGRRERFTEKIFSAVLHHMLETLGELATRVAVVELPGRGSDCIAPEQAADMLLAEAQQRPEHEMWTLVEPPAARRLITEHMVEQRRRIRRTL